MHDSTIEYNLTQPSLPCITAQHKHNEPKWYKLVHTNSKTVVFAALLQTRETRWHCGGDQARYHQSHHTPSYAHTHTCQDIFELGCIWTFARSMLGTTSHRTFCSGSVAVFVVALQRSRHEISACTTVLITQPPLASPHHGNQRNKPKC